MTEAQRLNRFSLILMLVACAVRTRPARADDRTTLAAEAAFADGVRLMKDGNCADAVPRFEESQRLEAASGTALDLAFCQAELGKIASAWLSYRRALSLSQAQNKPLHELLAREHADKLAPQVPLLRVVVAGDAGGALHVELDRNPLPKAMWSVPVPVDPGAHELTASVDGKDLWHARVNLAAGQRSSVALPNFVAPPPRSLPARPTPSHIVPEHRPQRAPGLPYVAAVSTGLTVIALSAGIIAGSVATAPPGGSTRAERQVDLGRRSGYAKTANVCFVAGGAFAAVAVVTFVWR